MKASHTRGSQTASRETSRLPRTRASLSSSSKLQVKHWLSITAYLGTLGVQIKIQIRSVRCSKMPFDTKTSHPAAGDRCLSLRLTSTRQHQAQLKAHARLNLVFLLSTFPPCLLPGETPPATDRFRGFQSCHGRAGWSRSHQPGLSGAHLHQTVCSVHTIPSLSSQTSFPAPSGCLGFHTTSTGNKIIMIMIMLQQKGCPKITDFGRNGELKALKCQP